MLVDLGSFCVTIFSYRGYFPLWVFYLAAALCSEYMQLFITLTRQLPDHKV